MMVKSFSFYSIVGSAMVLVATSLSPTAGRIVSEKINRIIGNHLAPNEILVFTEHDVNSYLAYESPPQIPKGVSNIRVQILPSRAVIDADVDFQELVVSDAPSPGIFLDLLLRGKRHFNVQCALSSSDGVFTVDVIAIEVDGATLEGPLLAWFLDKFLTLETVGVRFGQPIFLPKNLDYIRLQSSRVMVQGI